jgi:hypothetical protein
MHVFCHNPLATGELEVSRKGIVHAKAVSLTKTSRSDLFSAQNLLRKLALQNQTSSLHKLPPLSQQQHQRAKNSTTMLLLQSKW